MMLESTSAKVLYIEYTPEMEGIRGRGGLKANSFLRLRKVSENGRVRAEVEDHGPAEALLTNRAMLREKIHELREARRRAQARPLTINASGGASMIPLQVSQIPVSDQRARC